MSDKIKLLRDALKKSRMDEIMKHFAPAKAEVHEHEMVGEGHTPEEAVNDLHETHAEPTEGCPMCKGGIPMSEGGITVPEEETVPTLNDESEDEEDKFHSESILGNQADVDDLPAIASLRKRKYK